MTDKSDSVNQYRAIKLGLTGHEKNASNLPRRRLIRSQRKRNEGGACRIIDGLSAEGAVRSSTYRKVLAWVAFGPSSLHAETLFRTVSTPPCIIPRHVTQSSARRPHHLTAEAAVLPWKGPGWPGVAATSSSDFTPYWPRGMFIHAWNRSLSLA